MAGTGDALEETLVDERGEGIEGERGVSALRGWRLRLRGCRLRLRG
jgi:hypothetical protein